MAHGRPCLPCSSLAPALTLAGWNGLGLRPGRRERESAGQQQCPQNSVVDMNVLPFIVVAGSRRLTRGLTRFFTI